MTTSQHLVLIAADIERQAQVLRLEAMSLSEHQGVPLRNVAKAQQEIADMLREHAACLRPLKADTL